MPVYGGGKKCSRCDKTVYSNEEVLAQGESFHKRGCFTCQTCNKSLDSTNLCEQKPAGGKLAIYCKICYGRNFGPKGYGYGVGSGTLSNTGQWYSNIAHEKNKSVKFILIHASCVIFSDKNHENEVSIGSVCIFSLPCGIEFFILYTKKENHSNIGDKCPRRDHRLEH